MTIFAIAFIPLPTYLDLILLVEALILFITEKAREHESPHLLSKGRRLEFCPQVTKPPPHEMRLGIFKCRQILEVA